MKECYLMQRNEIMSAFHFFSCLSLFHLKTKKECYFEYPLLIFDNNVYAKYYPLFKIIVNKRYLGLCRINLDFLTFIFNK